MKSPHLISSGLALATLLLPSLWLAGCGTAEGLEPDATEPDATEPDATEPDATEPDATEPDAAEPDATEPDATEPDAAEPDATEPDATEPECRAAAECGIDTDCLFYSCTDGVCGTTNVAAGAACDDDGGVCDGDGACVLDEPSALGEGCEQQSECESGVCVEGVCCDEDCDGVCASCLAANTGSTDGTCAPATAGRMCRESSGACDLAESCDGTSPDCPSDVVAASRQPGSPECSGDYLCDGVDPGCPESCASDEDCTASTLCVVGMCTTPIPDDAPSRDSIDWLSQDFVPSDPTADPYCSPAERQEAHISTTLGYLRTDAAGDEGGISALAPTYNPERQRWESRVLTTFDFRPYAESQPGVGGIPNGADVFEAEGQYVSIVGTNDSGGVAGWASSWGDGCQFFDGWISYDRTNLPDFDPDNPGSWASVSSPIEGVPNPTRDNCPDGFGSTVTRWTFVTDFEFAADSTCPGDTGRKVMDAIVSDHDGGNHHEVFYFTDEYGSKSRWERWECGIPYPDHDFITDRCRFSDAQSVMHMAYGVDDDRRRIVNPSGDTCYMTDCRDFTTVQPIESPGYKAAAWHYGAAIYFSGNILRNGDFHSNDEGWNSLGTTAETATHPDGNHYLRISAADTGWHSVLGSSIDEFNRFFDASGEEAFLPKYVHWGARVRHTGDGGTARLALIEWGNPDGEIIDERALSPDSTWQWVEFHRLLGAATNGLDLRFRLDGISGLEVDDVYVYISNEAER